MTPGAPGNVLGPLTGTIDKVCKKALGSKPLKVVQQILNDLAGGNAGDVPKQIRKLLGGARHRRAGRRRQPDRAREAGS